MATHTHSKATPHRLLYFTVALMAVGTAVELVLLGHYEDAWQWVPVVLMGLSVAGLLLVLWRPVAGLVVAYRSLMGLCILSGILGVYFHLQANWEFETELHPTHTAWAHITNSLSGALPALAPGSMIAFGLLGLFTIAHIKTKHT